MSISRRKLLKGLGLSGVGSLLLPVEKLIGVNNSAEAENHHHTSTGSGNGVPSKYINSWVMVIDLEKCDGCEGLGTGPQCTASCDQGHYVPEGQDWMKVSKVKDLGGGTYWKPYPCNNCRNSPCVNVCPVGASYHSENGVVLINHQRCIGCRLCMGACPYQRRYFNWESQELPPEAALAQYSPEYPVPAVRGTVSKCMFCAHNAEAGKLPLCVSGCPRGALYFGDEERDRISNGMEVLSLKKTLADKSAYREQEKLGTEPRVYYLPGHGQKQGREPRE